MKASSPRAYEGAWKIWDIPSLPATAYSGKEAILRVGETHPDLVLMDIVLKGDMSGVEAAQRIRKCSSIPMVYLTAYADEDTLEKAKVTEPFGYIIKPCSTGSKPRARIGPKVPSVAEGDVLLFRGIGGL